MTEQDSLLYGVEYPPESGQLHYDFELRLPVIGDNIAAIEAQGVSTNLRLNVAMMARGLVKLGDIPPEEITYELLEKGLVDDDFDVLAEAREKLKKKRMRPKPSLPISGLPSSPSASMASPNPASSN
ncbi:hypothetical protein [Jeongeupia chitinilytica]|uniref:Phage tail assembly protein n=1 Tax=Jeongeupia chitinilytica TaxID=1041641 RepID=A0ABQ3H099_9NEIS|nr:hypothetical protein [Jeongeupia chitinilytica]GHD63869.1 hypothetical protein GCM10007350_22190 [Jeongeupia chitinilytica]